MSGRAALAAAARIEDQVIYGYGVVGAHLGGAEQRLAADRLAAHQLLRDRLAAAAGIGTDGAPAYRLPTPVGGKDSAVMLAIRLEDGAAAAAYAAVAATDAASNARRLAVDMLTDVAGAAAQWRTMIGATDDPALPGHPVATAPASQPSTTSTTSPSSSTSASASTS